jgi:AcrR family transcriptional regulator
MLPQCLDKDATFMVAKTAVSTLEQDTRERILEIAADLFAEKGYAGTYVREIVERAGVSKPVLYYYFRSKEGLFYAVLEWATDVQQGLLKEVFDVSGTTLERFIYLYRRVYEGIQEYQSLYKMLHSLIYGPPQGAPEYDYYKYQADMFDAVKRIYKEGLNAGEIKKADADEVAFLVLGLLDFSLNIDTIMPALSDPQRPERLLKLAFQGLQPKP